MKKWVILFGISVGVLSLSACNWSVNSEDIIVQSQAGEITKDEFYSQLKTQAGDQVLKQMIDTMLLEKKYKVSDKEIDTKIKDYEKQFGGKESLDQAIEQKGIKGENEFKKMIKQELLFEKAATNGVNVSEEEIKKAFEEKYKEEIKASHILVKDEETAKEVKAKLEESEDFSQLAREYSIDPGSKDRGGDLGYFRKESMVPEFDKVVFSMKVDEISDPVKTQHGYHIIKVTDKKTNTLEDMKVTIEKELKFSKAKPIDTLMSQLHKEADINIKDKDLKDALSKQPQTGMK